MDKNFKNRIKILAKRFNFSLNYLSDNSILMNNEEKFVRVFEDEKVRNTLNVSFNETENAIIIPDEFIFDLLYKLFNLKQEYELNPGKVIEFEDFLDIEYLSKKWVKEAMEKNLSGGNRILFEFYDKYLILVDDLAYYKTNIVLVNQYLS